MTTIEPDSDKIQQGFKYFNFLMLAMWRLGLGRWINAWPSVGGRIMVISHTGRKSGARRHTPVNYAVIDGDIYCTAGFGRTSDWYRNLIVHPDVEVWLPDGWWAGIADELIDTDSRLPIMREVLTASGLAARAVGLDLGKMSDEELDQATETYRLFRIRRTHACTGEDGPGDLAWVWPLATMILLPFALFRRKR